MVEEIIKEVESVYGTADLALLKYEDMKRFPYTQAALAEAIRLHPAVPKNGKICCAPNGSLIEPKGPGSAGLPSIHVRKGEWVTWTDYGMARRKDVWGEDAAEYHPERFIDVDAATGERSFKQHSPWKFHAFNGSLPRSCLGMNLAYFEAMAVCIAVLPRFKIRWSTPEEGQTAEWPLRYIASVTHPCEPYVATVEARC